MAGNHHDFACIHRTSRLQRMPSKGQMRKHLQHLGLVAFHARALAGGHHDHLHSRLDRVRIQSGCIARN